MSKNVKPVEVKQPKEKGKKKTLLAILIAATAVILCLALILGLAFCTEDGLKIIFGQKNDTSDVQSAGDGTQFGDGDNTGGYYYATRHLPDAELKIVTRPFLGDYTVSVEECYATVEGILSGRDYAVRERLKEMLEDGGAESVTKFVRESKTYGGLVTRILDK